MSCVDFFFLQEQFFYIRDRIVFENNLGMLYLNCYSCSKEGHIAANCPSLHFFVQDKEKFVNEYIKVQQDFRSSFRRRRTVKFSARKNLEALTNSAIQLRSLVGNLDLVIDQTRELDTLINFGTDSFDEVLDRKVYSPYQQNNGAD